MRSRMWMRLALAAVIGVLGLAREAAANNLQVTNVTVTARDATTAKVKFDISWENSWRMTTRNHDAAWVFFKVRKQGDTTWTNHVVLAGTGPNPANYATGTGTGIELIVPTDGVGLFVRRSAEGAGNVAVANVQAVWNIASSGMTSTDIVEMKAFAVEMVYAAQGSFEAGDGANGFTKTLINTADPTVAPSGNPLAGGYPSGQTAPTTTSWPNGFNAFYCMKYEITEGAWVDFFNTLKAAQKTTRDLTSNGLGDKNSDLVVHRNTVAWTSGDATTAARDRACSYLKWSDGAAFADWAGLRPMTELEFEKACRGPIAAVANEFAYGGATQPTMQTGHSASPADGSGAETATPASASINIYDQLGGGGAARVGIYATASSTRAQAGASYWGIMELSGNMTERPVTINDATGRSFTGLHGDGNLDANGDANVTAWPGTDANGTMFRGGSAGSLYAPCYVSSRELNVNPYRDYPRGWRGVRSAPAGVGP